MLKGSYQVSHWSGARRRLNCLAREPFVFAFLMLISMCHDTQHFYTWILGAKLKFSHLETRLYKPSQIPNTPVSFLLCSTRSMPVSFKVYLGFFQNSTDYASDGYTEGILAHLSRTRSQNTLLFHWIQWGRGIGTFQSTKSAITYTKSSHPQLSQPLMPHQHQQQDVSL